MTELPADLADGGSNPADDAVLIHRALAAGGQSDLVWGHAAVRDPAGRGVWMKAAGWGMEEVAPPRIVLVDPDGEVLAGAGARHLEFPIHTELMLARPELAVTVHSHSEAAIAFASLEVPLRPLSHDAVPFLSPDVVRFTGTSDLISSRERGRELAAAIGSANGCLIPGHGLVVVGVDAASAVMHAVLLERSCRIQLAAIAAGGPRRWSSDAEVVAKRSSAWGPRQFAAGYEYLLRRAEALYGTPEGAPPVDL